MAREEDESGAAGGTRGGSSPLECARSRGSLGQSIGTQDHRSGVAAIGVDSHFDASRSESELCGISFRVICGS